MSMLLAISESPVITAPVPVQELLDGSGLAWAGWILWLPLISLALCGVCWAMKVSSKLPAWITVAALGTSFAFTLQLYLGYEGPVRIELFEWLSVHWSSGSFVADIALYVDSLTLLWMLFVTGLGTLIALYASEYMSHDQGRPYARFFAGVSCFLFAMSALVMSDNFLMLYLGWEGVGFASYWLIGYFYQRPAAVAAAKKAFIINRIGDLGLAVAVYLIYATFGTVQYDEVMTILNDGGNAARFETFSATLIPWCLMLAAFGKSAQLPLYVWLPDAMEGPTPVSALIHAATMVTAGIYLLARTYPLFQHLDPTALHVVAWVGGLTALLGATIAMAQYDIKRIMAYSTISQLGFMFLGLGVLTTYGAAYHVFTHAFFKAALFLTCGAIMHGFAGQLDLRKLSGLRHLTGWKITSWVMFIGVLALAGFPATSGFFSKDAILAEAFITQGPGFRVLGWIAIITAGMTAYYAFRVWFRVCAGPVHYEPGDEHHDGGDGSFRPHAPGWAINFVLIVLGVGTIVAAAPYFMGNTSTHYTLDAGHHGGIISGGWVAEMVHDSHAAGGVPVPHVAGSDHHPTIFGADPHTAMYWISGIVGTIGLLLAVWIHLLRRSTADAWRAALLSRRSTRWLPRAMEQKWYVDEIYIALIRTPLWVTGHLLTLVDRYLIDGLIVDGVAQLPRAVARWFQPLQSGAVQGYAVTMAGGAALIGLLILFAPEIISFVQGLGSGGAG